MSKVFGISYKQGEIILVPFPYSDLSATKKRPVLVVSNNNYNKKYEDIIVCVITSNLNKDEYSKTIRNNDLESGFLPEDSAVKVHKLFTISKSRVIKKFSRVKKEFYKAIYSKLKELFDEEN